MVFFDIGLYFSGSLDEVIEIGIKFLVVVFFLKSYVKVFFYLYLLYVFFIKVYMIYVVYVMFILICGWRNGLNLGIMIVLMYLLYRKDCIGEWFG